MLGSRVMLADDGGGAATAAVAAVRAGSAPRDGQRPGLCHNPGRSILISASQDCESTILADYQDYNPQSWLLDPGGQDF